MGFLVKPASFICFIILGYVLKAVGFFGKNDHKVLTRLMLNVTLPCAVVQAFDGFQSDAQLFVVSLIALIVCLLPILLMYLLTAGKSRGERIFRMLNIGGYNTACFAAPLIQMFLGAPGLLVSVFFDIGNALMMTGGAYAVTAALLKLDGAKKESPWQTIAKFLRSVPFDTYLVMLLLSALSLRLPEWFFELIRPAAQANAFIAMLTIGILFEPVTDMGQLAACGKNLLCRYSLAVLFALGFWFLLPLDTLIRQVLVVMCFAPLSSLCPIYTDYCGGDTALSSVTNSISIVIGMIVMLSLLISFGAV